MIALLIIGRPGSGKTHLARKLLTQQPDFILVDDPKDLNYIDFLASLRSDLIICDPHLCGQAARDGCYRYLEGKGYTVFSMFFEDDILKCEKNITRRADGRLVRAKSFAYDVPSGVRLMPIWDSSSCEASENP